MVRPCRISHAGRRSSRYGAAEPSWGVAVLRAGNSPFFPFSRADSKTDPEAQLRLMPLEMAQVECPRYPGGAAPHLDVPSRRKERPVAQPHVERRTEIEGLP